MTTKNIIRNTIILTVIILTFAFALQGKFLKLKYLIYKTKVEGYGVKKYFTNTENKNIYFVLLTSVQERDFSSDKLIIYKNYLFNVRKIGTIEDGKIEFHKLNFKDIDNDGIKDIVVTTSSSGNCFCCEKIEIYNIKNEKLTKLFKNKFGCISDIVDLDNDDIYEIILFDDRFEFYDDLCHACSPAVEYIYQKKEQRYINSSVQFLNFYDKKIKHLTKNIEFDFNNKKYLDSDYQRYYLGNTITLLLNYSAKGEKEKGIEHYKKYAQPKFFTDEIKKTCAKIFSDPEDFLNKYKVLQE